MIIIPELEGLRVIISAEVRNAIANLYKVQTNLTKLGTVTKKETEKIGGFLTKWRLGWIAVGGAAIASLYELAKSSAYMNMWFTEATGALQYFMDSALEPLSPIIEPLLDLLYKFGDAFNKLPDIIRGAVGAIILAVGALGGLKILDIIFGTDFAAKAIAFIKGAFTAIGSSILGAIAAGIGLGMTAVWILDKLGILKALDEAGRSLEERIPTIFNLLEIILAPLGALGMTVINIIRGDFDRIIPDLKRILWTESFEKVWDYVNINVIQKIQDMLHGWSETLRQWAKGVIGFSPTLKQIGAEIPDTIMGGAGANPVSVSNIVNSNGAGRGSAGNTIHFNPTINITGAQMNSQMDLRQLASQLSSYFRDDMTRYARGTI